MTIIKALYGSPDRPMRIGEIEIPCYVLEDERRVITQSGMIKGLSMSKAGGKNDVSQLAYFASSKSIKPFVNNQLMMSIKNPIRFQAPSSGPICYGYEATILSDLCAAILECRDQGNLNHQQIHIARRAERLIIGFARVGITALVDEATGFQAHRTKDALQTILDQFIATELRPWVRTFPSEFYEQIFRLNNWPFTSESIKQKPGVVGRWTNEIVYERLAPGICAALHAKAERDSQGRLKHRLHQLLTENIGHPVLKGLLGSVIALMRAAPSWAAFQWMLQRAYPKPNTNLELSLDDMVNPDKAAQA